MTVDQGDAACAGSKHAAVCTGHREIGDLLVQRRASLRHRLQPFAAIPSCQQGAMGVAFEAFELLLDAGLQPDHVATFDQPLTIG